MQGALQASIEDLLRQKVSGCVSAEVTATETGLLSGRSAACPTTVLGTAEP